MWKERFQIRLSTKYIPPLKSLTPSFLSDCLADGVPWPNFVTCNKVVVFFIKHQLTTWKKNLDPDIICDPLSENLLFSQNSDLP